MRKKAAAIDQEIRERMTLLDRLALLKPMHEICRAYHVRIEDALSRLRTKRVVQARDACFTQLHTLGLSYNEIGKAWGCDHSTVIAAVKRHRGRQAA